MSAAWSVQELEACFIVIDSAGRHPIAIGPPLVADVCCWPILLQKDFWSRSEE